jgi:hypothetical protein
MIIFHQAVVDILTVKPQATYTAMTSINPHRCPVGHSPCIGISPCQDQVMTLAKYVLKFLMVEMLHITFRTNYQD